MTFSDLEAARAIGRRYLAASPEAARDALRLGDQLTALRPADSADLRQVLARCRVEDATQRKLVLVDGWLLPRTEAQVCALTVLL